MLLGSGQAVEAEAARETVDAGLAVQQEWRLLRSTLSSGVVVRNS